MTQRTRIGKEGETLQCPRCGLLGTLVHRKTQNAKGDSKRYWYVRHAREANRDAYCYIGKEPLIKEYRPPKPQKGFQTHF